MANNATGLPDTRHAGSGGDQHDFTQSLAARTPLGRGDDAVTSFPSGRIVEPLRRSRSSNPATTCPFGSLKTVDGDRVILGGMLVCGGNNFNVPNKVLDLEVSGSWLIEIRLSGIVAAADDDDVVFMPGIASVSGTPEWHSIPRVTLLENYTNTTNPSTPTGTGTIVIGIGILDIVDGVASLTATGCGTITVDQCGGFLTHDH